MKQCMVEWGGGDERAKFRLKTDTDIIVTSKYGTSTGIHKIDTDMKQFRAKGGGGVRERSSTIVTPKYGTSTGILKTDTDMKQFRAKGGGGG